MTDETAQFGHVDANGTSLVDELERLTQLENALDALCKVTGRDIFVMYPAKNEEIAPYLIKEIIKTTKLLKK